MIDFKEIQENQKVLNSMLGRNFDTIPQIVFDKIIEQQDAMWHVLERYNTEIEHQGLRISELERKYKILHSIYEDEIEYSGEIQNKLARTLIWARKKLKKTEDES